jgi:hypothetical protein
MAIATLTFDLTDPDDLIEHKRCIKAIDVCLVIWDMDQYLRTRIKYESDTMTNEECGAYETMRDKLREILEERSISFDELIN